MVNIISNTPSWVFITFFTLIILGVIQSKKQSISPSRVLLLPVSMIIFSFFGVYSAFGTTVFAIALWFAGLSIGISFSLALKYPKHVTFSEPDRKFTIPGSWAPLCIMMAIFFTKYGVGFTIATENPMIHDLKFIAFVCVCYGLFSGIFLARMIIVFKEKLNQKVT